MYLIFSSKSDLKMVEIRSPGNYTSNRTKMIVFVSPKNLKGAIGCFPFKFFESFIRKFHYDKPYKNKYKSARLPSP